MADYESLHRSISEIYRKRYDNYSAEQKETLKWLDDEYNKMMHVKGRDFTFNAGDYYLTLYNETIAERLQAVGLPTLVLPHFNTEGLTDDVKTEKTRKKENRKYIVIACYSIELYLWENTGDEKLGARIPTFAISAYDRLNKKNERFYMDDNNTNGSTIEIVIDTDEIEVDEFE